MPLSYKANLYRSFFQLVAALFGDEDGFVRLPILRGPARGLRFGFDLQRPVEKAYVMGSYDTAEVNLLHQLCRPGWVVWDCGAYLGFYTAVFARLVGATGKVVVFEPDPANMARTQQNIGLNGFTNVRFQPVAIGAPAGELTFIVSKSSNSHIPGMYIGANSQQYEQTTERKDGEIRVRCISLDQAYQDPAIPTPDLIKIDIEGAEKEALQHASHIVSQVRPLILLELHNPECDAAAWQFAGRYNYRLQRTHDGVWIERPEDVHGTLLCIPAN